MSFYDTQTYCEILDMKVVVVGICNKISFTKVWITPTITKISFCQIFEIRKTYRKKSRVN